MSIKRGKNREEGSEKATINFITTIVDITISGIRKLVSSYQCFVFTQQFLTTERRLLTKQKFPILQGWQTLFAAWCQLSLFQYHPVCSS
jgi:hypothetical protein